LGKGMAAVEAVSTRAGARRPGNGNAPVSRLQSLFSRFFFRSGHFPPKLSKRLTQ
jgi:hypothetical protein